MSEKKIDIKEMLRKSGDVKPAAEVETDINAVLGNLPQGFDKSKIENIGTTTGVEVKSEEVFGSAVKGGGISGGILSGDQLSGIEAYIKEMDETAELAKQEMETLGIKTDDEGGILVPENVYDKIAEAQALYGTTEGDPYNLVKKEDIDPDVLEARKKALEEAKCGSLEIDKKEEDSDEDDDDSLVEETEDKEAFAKKYQEAIVVIDKSQMGQVVQFTEAERAKMERAKKIKLEEVETVQLSTLKTKKAKKGSADKILKKSNSIRTTNIVCPIAGLTFVMRGCSTFELMGLISDDDATPMGLINKWTLVHAKIEDCSIPELKTDFNKFLNSVTQMEYDVFVYGILCATYPDEDVFPLKCPKCASEIEHRYNIRTLLRIEEMSDRLREAFKHTVDSSFTESSAKECFESSLINTVERIKLPESGHIVELGVQSAYSFIHESVDSLNKMDVKYAQAAILASPTQSIFIYDESDGEWFEIDGAEDKTKVIYNLSNLDISILGAKISKNIEGMQFSFGLMDINCGNKKCRSHVNSIEVDLDSILFHKYQQAMNTTID